MAYIWRAQYNDSTTLNQIDEDGTKHAYLDVDREKLATFALYKDSIVEGVNPALIIIFDGDGEKLVWTRRVYNHLSGDSTTSHIIGKKGEFILALQEDGSIIARHNFKDDGLFDEVLNG